MPTDQRLRRNLKTIGPASFALISLIAADPSAAEIKIITATGEYRMGDNDTRTDAKRLALLDAKRLALEQAGTYLESVTEIKNLSIARDELNAYTAGIVEVAELDTKDVLDGATHVIRVQVTAKIDMDVAIRGVDAFYKNEHAKAELLKLRVERDQLKQVIETKTRELIALTSKAEIEVVSKQRQQALTKVDLHDLILQASIALWGPEFYGQRGSSSVKGRETARALVRQALAVDPAYPDAHFVMAEILIEEGNLKNAAQEIRTAARLSPDEVLDRMAYGKALADIGDFAGAIEEYRVALRLDPNNLVVHRWLAEALYQLGDKRETIIERRAVVNLAPDDFAAHYELADALLDSGELQEAAGEYRVYLDLFGDRDDATGWKLVATLWKSGNPMAAFTEYVALRGRWSGFSIPFGWSSAHRVAEMHVDFGEMFLARGRKSEAVAEFRGYLEVAIGPQYSEARVRQVRARLHQLENSEGKH